MGISSSGGTTQTNAFVSFENKSRFCGAVQDIRILPIYPELLPHLQEAFDHAAAGTEYLITRYRKKNYNLRTSFERIICKAQLKPWPKLFQNLRSSRETELTQKFPLHVVCAWMGNSQLVAAKHYLQVTDEHFNAASGRDDVMQNQRQHNTAQVSAAVQPETEEIANSETCSGM